MHTPLNRPRKWSQHGSIYERKPRSLPTAFAFLMRPWLTFFGTPKSAQNSLMIWLWSACSTMPPTCAQELSKEGLNKRGRLAAWASVSFSGLRTGDGLATQLEELLVAEDQTGEAHSRRERPVLRGAHDSRGATAHCRASDTHGCDECR